MALSDADRSRFAAQVRDLALIETDEEPASIERTIEEANADRIARGAAPLEAEDHPEEQLYRRARALGLRGRRR